MQWARVPVTRGGTVQRKGLMATFGVATGRPAQPNGRPRECERGVESNRQAGGSGENYVHEKFVNLSV